jgi:hypothetical protein
VSQTPGSNHSWFKLVPESRIVTYEQMGWMFSYVQYVGDYLSVVMEYRCCCRTWEEPPYLKKGTHI